MSTNVGSLNCSLSLSAYEFQQGLARSETAALEFADVVSTQSARADVALGRVGKSAGKTNIAGAVSQVGYLVQDFSSQIDRGIGPAIGAITNNVQMLGSYFGPVAGATTAIGAAVAGVILPSAIEWLMNTKQLAKEAEEAADQFNRFVALRKDVAALETLGGAEKERKDLEQQIEINEKLKKSVADRIVMEQDTLSVLKKQNDARFIGIRNSAIGDINFGGVLDWAVGNEDHIRAVRVGELTKSLKKERETYEKMFAEGVAAHDKLNAIGPNSLAGAKEEEVKKSAEFDKHFDESAKRQKDMWAAEADIKKKGLNEFGSATQNAQAKIEAERLHLVKLGISAESAARFEAQSKVALKMAEITDQEKKISEMGAAAGMSAGVVRSSSAGVTAINRAMAGTNSEQSIAKESLKVQKDSLIELKKAARVTMVSLSG